MGLVIKHNMMAQVALRNLGATYRNLAESINALSSGLRINSADDDAAGLAVRELMRAEVAGLGQGIQQIPLYPGTVSIDVGDEQLVGWFLLTHGNTSSCLFETGQASYNRMRSVVVAL